jgi:leucyl-tRNA synthetase
VKRFLDRLWASCATAPRKAHRTRRCCASCTTIRKVGEDIPALSYNTAIAAMMEYMNTLRKGERTPHRDEVRPVVQLVAPFAPHVAEELWEMLGATESVFDSGWPAYDPAMLETDTIELVVQVGGRTRGKLVVAKGITADAALAAARAEPAIGKFITGEPKKVILVPGRLLNVVL